ncbi:MAG: ABC transporter ATP-binding protein, partial [Defluviitaleaceae bacterium]|nr:ABC transporter ATP-binding protein [Defluviitaleaceae bacterium]
MSSQDIVIENAVVHFKVSAGFVRAVDRVSIRIEAGKITGLIGESGCGKSLLGLAILGLLPPYAYTSGDIVYDGLHIPSATQKELKVLRGRKIGFIPQSPADSLNPVRRIGSQLDEALSLVEKHAQSRRQLAEQLLRGFGFDNPARILRSYPFELSGGMQQRALCAIGVCCSPQWVLADEPTKGLDQALCHQVRETLLSLSNFGVDSMFVITHDLDLAENLCDVIAIMYAGQIVEMGEQVLN